METTSQLKVLLINPSSIQSGTRVPDLGLGYLATAARNAGFYVDLIQGNEAACEDIYRKLVESKPDVIGIKVISLEIPAVRKVVSWCREVCPGAKVVLGGPHISIAPPHLSMEFFHPDYCIRGEGEVPFPQLLRAIAGEPLSMNDMSGLIHIENGELIANPVSVHRDLDDFGIPAWDLMDPRTFSGGWYFWSPEHPRAPILTSRGCPYRCTFCAQNVVGGKRLRQRSLQGVFEEMQLLMETYGVSNFDLIDDNFLIRRDFVVGFCNKIIERGWKIRWNCCGARLDILDPELVRLMDRAGCNIISIGFESGSQRVLDYMKKDLNLLFAYQQARMIRKNSSIKIMGLFIIGYPTETEEEIRQTIRFALKLPLFIANFSTYMVLPGCEETEKLLASGEIEDIPWDQLGLDSHVYAPKGMTRKRLKQLYELALLRFYMRPLVLIRILGYSWRRIPWFINHVLFKFTWKYRKTGAME